MHGDSVVAQIARNAAADYLMAYENWSAHEATKVRNGHFDDRATPAAFLQLACDAFAHRLTSPAAGDVMWHLRDALDDSETLMNGEVVLTVEHAARLNADVYGWEMSSAEPFTGEQAWDELVNVDDRTSPEEYPDMCLITRDELIEFMSRAASPTTGSADQGDPCEARGGVEGLREAGQMAAFRAMYGPGADPFQNPESFDFCAKVADAVVQALTGRQS